MIGLSYNNELTPMYVRITRKRIGVMDRVYEVVMNELNERGWW